MKNLVQPKIIHDTTQEPPSEEQSRRPTELGTNIYQFPNNLVNIIAIKICHDRHIIRDAVAQVQNLLSAEFVKSEAIERNDWPAFVKDINSALPTVSSTL